MRHYDNLVIGSGPGGEGATVMLAKSGGKVALAEKFGDVGGGAERAESRLHRGGEPLFRR